MFYITITIKAVVFKPHQFIGEGLNFGGHWCDSTCTIDAFHRSPKLIYTWLFSHKNEAIFNFLSNTCVLLTRYN